MDGEVESLLNGEAHLHWMERWGLHPMEVYRSVVGALAVVFDGRKRHFPGPFDTSPEFVMWQNRSDQFCHFSSTSLTLGFDQGQVLLLHAPRYMGLSRHVTLAQADMSPWRKQTCLLGTNRHVSFAQTDMSLSHKQTCLLRASRHVSLDTSTLKGINFGLQT